MYIELENIYYQNGLFSILTDSKEAEAAASAYNTPYNQGGPSGSGNNDLPPSYNVSDVEHCIEKMSNFFFVSYLIELATQLWWCIEKKSLKEAAYYIPLRRNAK